jgi:hypothetical protein
MTRDNLWMRRNDLAPPRQDVSAQTTEQDDPI